MIDKQLLQADSTNNYTGFGADWLAPLIEIDLVNQELSLKAPLDGQHSLFNSA